MVVASRVVGRAGVYMVNLNCMKLPLTHLFSAGCGAVNFSVGRTHIATLVTNRSTALRISSRLLRSTLTGNFGYATGVRRVHSCGFCMITIPAPMSGGGGPSLAPLCNTDAAINGMVSGKSVIICRSAICPNIARSRYVPIIRGISKLGFGRSFFTNCDPRHVGPKSGLRAMRGVGGIASNSAPRVNGGMGRMCTSMVATNARLTPAVGMTRTTGMVRGSRHSVGVTFIGRLSGVFAGVNVSARSMLRTTSAG